VIITGFMTVAVVKAGQPWNWVALAAVVAESVAYQWAVARQPIVVGDVVALAAAAAETRDHLDEFITAATATAADAVAVVRRYDDAEADRLQEQIGAAFTSWHES
jgi:hypothetical protein